MKILWFIPTHGDSRYLGTSHGARQTDLDYFKQVAIAADTLGYEGVLLPTGRSCEDSWMVAASLVDVTKRLKFLVALRPGIIQPVQTARMAATLDRLSGGRVLVNLVTGGDPDELAGDGLFLEPRGALRGLRRVRDDLARRAAGQPRQRGDRLRRQAPEGQGRQGALPAGARSRIRRCSSAARRARRTTWRRRSATPT